jgi:hypothetical protein
MNVQKNDVFEKKILMPYIPVECLTKFAKGGLCPKASGTISIY